MDDAAAAPRSTLIPTLGCSVMSALMSWLPDDITLSLPAVVRAERPLSAAVAPEQRNPCELQAEEGAADDEGDELPGRSLSRLIGRRRFTTANHKTEAPPVEVSVPAVQRSL
ncbi:hypothetical protein CCH79_00019298 [Gambusia affinis]|uniref:Uncharacterized protein n=1 Tax=Gambusia affinis TaxID=33528 RepID=A0A315WBJ9_GAMAF|nr:hypothetical protein CCH79_00019298 [Gambusia affinis]